MLLRWLEGKRSRKESSRACKHSTPEYSKPRSSCTDAEGCFGWASVPDALVLAVHVAKVVDWDHFKRKAQPKLDVCVFGQTSQHLVQLGSGPRPPCPFEQAWRERLRLPWDRSKGAVWPDSLSDLR